MKVDEIFFLDAYFDLLIVNILSNSKPYTLAYSKHHSAHKITILD